MGDWILGENYKGSHNKHMEVNRILKKYHEKDIPYFPTTLSFLTYSAVLTSSVVFNGGALLKGAH